ncbi:low specificity L-threonine aldolase [uncultured Ilyobacter sp.]|uniref:threonine aldolase family protein n=1 Tax=uncultured Ilyobacter sp. TaxID=544433 RepID=UPI0029F47418|nr:low specificity L-threonine aldolase [uncultured Ilyobacter sp.]
MSECTEDKIIYSFKNDYSEGAHPTILNAMISANMDQHDGYGEDSYSKEAVEILREKINNQNVDIHFVAGGTQANLVVISSILRPYESVIAADTGHISTHETGAIEATGHKINTVETSDGKLTSEKIKKIMDEHSSEHMVKPAMVFISNSTELGTVYKKKELEKISLFCRENDLILYMDGARLGAALSSDKSDLTLEDISKIVDIFYIGGTKNGALLGEAIIISNDRLKKNFRYNIKQKGALMAKGRILGIQFKELFRENLFFSLGKHANLMALRLGEKIEKLGYDFLSETESNQIFPILPNEIIENINKKYGFYIWEKIDKDISAVRLVTSWATKEEMIDKFIADLKSYSLSK